MIEFMKAFEKLAMNCVVMALKINLNTGEYKILHLDKGENTTTSPLLKDWIEESCDKGLIHPDYIGAFKHIVNVEYLSKALKYKKYIHLKLKRAPGKNTEYNSNVITILPVDETIKEAYLMVYNIE